MIKTILILPLIFVSIRQFSQSNLRFEEVNAINSLSQNSVPVIHQDKKGFLWLGTYNGLNKFDGYKFKVYKLKENNSRLSTNRINSIYEDSHGIIWIGAYDGSFHRFNPETESLKRFPSLEEIPGQARITGYYESRDKDIWLTSEAGVYYIVEYPGDKIFTNHINLHFSNNCLFAICDASGDCWVGTDNGLNKIKKNEFRKKKPEVSTWFNQEKPENRIEFKSAISTGHLLWFATDKGIFCYNSKTGCFEDFKKSEDYTDLKSKNITSLGTKGTDLWIGTSSAKLFHFDIRSQAFTSFPINDKKTGDEIQSIFEDHYGQVWLLTEKFGITRFDKSVKKFFRYELTPRELENLTDLERTVIYEDKEKNLWLCIHNRGLALYDRINDKFDFFINNPQDVSSISSNVTLSINEDKEGILWVGTSIFGKGLNKVIKLDPAFEYIKPVEKATNKIKNLVRSTFQDSNGFIWVATKGGEIFIYDSELNPVHTIRKESKNKYPGYNIYSIYEDNSGFIWMCSKGGGLFRSKTPVSFPASYYKNISFLQIKNNPFDTNSISNNNIYDIIQDKKGNFWVATFGGGLNLMTGREGNYKFRRFSREDNLLSEKLRDLYIDDKNKLWIATINGINYIDLSDKNFSIKIPEIDNYSEHEGLYSDVMMIAGSDSNIWLATYGEGVIKLTCTEEQIFKLKKYTKQNGLKDELYLSLVMDTFGYMWFAGENSISRYNPVKDNFEIFDKKNGLPCLQFSEKTCYPCSDGSLLFGSLEGFYIISPNKTGINKYKPNVCLTDFQLFNKSISPGQENSPLKKSISYSGEIILKHYQSVFSIEFAALSFKSPEDNLYAYILEGFDKEWNFSGSEHKATYTNLKPGKYVFRVKGSNCDQVWNETGTSLKITIIPPFWKSTLAYIIYFILAVALIICTQLLVFWIARLKNNLIIERQVAESKMRFFTNISHDFKTPLTLIIGPIEKLLSLENLSSEIRQQIFLVHKNANRLLRLVTQMLDFRKIQKKKVELQNQEIEVIPFIQQIFDSFKGLAKQKNILFSFNYNQSEIKIWGDIQKLDSTIFNLLSNAFKFTPDYGRISIRINSSSEKIEIFISDSGIGIDAEKLPYIFDRFFVSHMDTNNPSSGTGIGLSLVYEYVKLHKGDITVLSSTRRGTTFKIILPKGTGTLKENVIQKEESSFSYAPFFNNHEPFVLSKDQRDEQQNKKAIVLIVEDNVEMAKYIEDILKPLCVTIPAKDGIDGFNKALKYIPDLIVMDVMMPGMDGIELTKQLKSEFTTCHIPVLMLTAKSEIENQVDGIESGADLYLSKPFNHQLLYAYAKGFLRKNERNPKFRNDVSSLNTVIVKRDKLFIEKLISHIDENISNADFSVEKLASYFDVSRTVFFKKVKTLIGLQPVELIRWHRLNKARKLIEEKELNITEIAYMVGFNDIRYFSTCFKKQFGVSPTTYLKSREHLINN